MKIGYENTDKKLEIEIYGLTFELQNVEKLKEYENVDDNDLNGLEKMIEVVLGDGAIDKLNEQREKDGYKKIDNKVALNLLVGICNTYTTEYTNQIMQPIEDSVDRINRYNKRYNYSKKRRGKYGKY